MTEICNQNKVKRLILNAQGIKGKKYAKKQKPIKNERYFRMQKLDVWQRNSKPVPFNKASCCICECKDSKI